MTVEKTKLEPLHILEVPLEKEEMIMIHHEHEGHHGDCGCHEHGHQQHVGHHHHEGHHGDCGCHDHQHHHTHCDCTPISIDNLTNEQVDFLLSLCSRQYLPVAQMIVKSSKESDFLTVALAPVHLFAPTDSMDTIKNVGKNLLELEEKGMITLDYDLPLDGYDYQMYYQSEIYEYFCNTVAEGKENASFLGDLASMECGSIAPTPACLDLLQGQA